MSTIQQLDNLTLLRLYVIYKAKENILCEIIFIFSFGLADFYEKIYVKEIWKFTLYM